MFDAGTYEKRLEGILDRLDSTLALVRGEEADALAEMNAEFEDALAFFSGIDVRRTGAAEEYRDALEEFEALHGDYARLPGTEEVRRELALTVNQAMAELQKTEDAN